MISCWAALLPPAFSQLFKSWAFCCAERAEGARITRWQISTRCLGVSGCVAPAPAALEPFSPDTPLLRLPVASLLERALLVDLLPLPHAAKSTPPTSARTRHVDSFRIGIPFVEGRSPARSRSCGSHLIGCSHPALALQRL